MASFSVLIPEKAGATLTGQVRSLQGVNVHASPVALTETSGLFTGTIAEALDGYNYIIHVFESGVEIRQFSYHPQHPDSPSTAADSDGGYEFTGGFTDRTTGTAGASDVGSNVSYTQALVDEDRWMRFGFDSAQQASNDFAYWSDPAPAPTAGIGLFGGSYMPSGVDSLFDFDFNASSYSDAVETGSLQYTAANGSLDFTQCKAGDLALCRFDFNVLPQIANTTLEVAMIWQTRDSNDNPTFTFALTGEPQFFGTGSVGRTFLARPILSAYFASNEDVNARALFAVRADNPIQIQPLTTLITIQR
jgi:hypothetical protein